MSASLFRRSYSFNITSVSRHCNFPVKPNRHAHCLQYFSPFIVFLTLLISIVRYRIEWETRNICLYYFWDVTRNPMWRETPSTKGTTGYRTFYKPVRIASTCMIPIEGLHRILPGVYHKSLSEILKYSPRRKLPWPSRYYRHLIITLAWKKVSKNK